jgi:hypothetical protein
MSRMIKVPARRRVGEVELHKVDAAILLDQEELLFLVEHPLEGGQRTVQAEDLLAEPFPVASVEDKNKLLGGGVCGGGTIDGK